MLPSWLVNMVILGLAGGVLRLKHVTTGIFASKISFVSTIAPVVSVAGSVALNEVDGALPLWVDQLLTTMLDAVISIGVPWLFWQLVDVIRKNKEELRLRLGEHRYNLARGFVVKAIMMAANDLTTQAGQARMSTILDLLEKQLKVAGVKIELDFMIPIIQSELEALGISLEDPADEEE